MNGCAYGDVSAAMRPSAAAMSPAAAQARGGLLGLLDEMAALHDAGEPGALGIVYATVGSTYQKAGALVLLDSSGMRHGVISGGCLEPELEERARTAIAAGRADVVDFDTRSDEDVVFGSGTGCRGRIRLLLLPQPPGAALTGMLRQLARDGGAFDLAFVVEGPLLGHGTASLDGTAVRWDASGRLDARDAAADAPVVRLRIEPPPQVLLLGAGPEAPPLNQFLHRLGWTVTIVEHRGRWLRFARAANPESLIEMPPDAAFEIWRHRHACAAVAMSHNYALDIKHLGHCARSDLTYVGLLGPSYRRDELLAELGDETASRLRGRLHSPVGLPLGGAGPEPLALSIAAELQQHVAKRKAT